MNPFRAFRARPMTPEFIAAWKAYEQASRKAAEQYEALPISFQRSKANITTQPKDRP